LTTPIPINSAHPLILVLSYSYLLTIKPDEEKQNNWTKVSAGAHLWRSLACNTPTEGAPSLRFLQGWAALLRVRFDFVADT
jgi:hypothetical protein